MNLQQAVPTRSSSNGFGRRRVDRETGARMDTNRMHSGKPTSPTFGLANGSQVGGVAGPLHDRLIYITTCLIGQHVEVLLKNGSIISGIFHSASADKDFGVVLKMARVIKDGSVREQKQINDAVKKPQTMIITSRELVHIFAKDASLSSDEFVNGHAKEKRNDLLIDSVISHPHHVEVERELERWIPDKDDPACPELENIFDGTWNRNWDQFETNKTLFGVKSTFNEELYTTKLERGPQMRELEIEASRIAREIEGEETHDHHLAEERGIYFHEDFDLDEESRYSAVRREVDDGRYEENESSFLDARNVETFGGSFGSVIGRSYSEVLSKKVKSEAQASSTCSSADDDSQIPADKDVYVSGFTDHVTWPTSVCPVKSSTFMDEKNRLDEKTTKDQDAEKILLNGCTDRIASEEAQTSKSKDVHPSTHLKGLSPSAATYDPSSSVQVNKCPAGESSDSAISGKLSSASEAVNTSPRPGCSTSSTSECVGAGSVSGGPGLSPSSSVGSLSSEKSTLNPNAKEFKLNPNAKSFMPSASVRLHTPVSDGSFYYASNISAAPHMHGISMGMGIGPTFGGHQPVVYSPQAAQLQSPQAFIHPNGPPLYGQQMILGQPRPVYYMPTYPAEMPYKGRNF
ncbi:polyadenylate-binding protein-interacting protein 4-like [Phoenix dactylifera]|uniref:Polyadenylate-binding protein-interacting protein 4-like n=1 Tax=Phoenix dactylifera TaxID=42345 RepID=A0A8B7BY67_PHODC|nr:polyadenylate-binding protein-interacting protein 4-like [Phoenix dactylifera]XP_008787857.1 polyadenylate-binding protein-interacting protein 4-like [Phoenix dactylifera]